ncbi:hypothetical protein ACLWXD_001644 [Campylobacter coli]
MDIFFENNKALEDDVNMNSSENKFSITCFFRLNHRDRLILMLVKAKEHKHL